MKMTKTFEVTKEVDLEEAREMKGGKCDFDAYPNWDINYLGEEERFLSSLMKELESHNQYSGITVKTTEKG